MKAGDIVKVKGRRGTVKLFARFANGNEGWWGWWHDKKGGDGRYFIPVRDGDIKEKK